MVNSGDAVFGKWDIILRRLEAGFRAFVEANPPATRSDAYKLWIAKWNDLGVSLGLKYGTPASPFIQTLYRNLLSVLRDAQAKWRFIPKGTAYHQIGWSKLISGRPSDKVEAEKYFLTAMIEDALQDVLEAGTIFHFRENPAYQTLLIQYKRPRELLERIAGFAAEVVNRKEDHLRLLFVENAELILFEYGRNNGWAEFDAPTL